MRMLHWSSTSFGYMKPSTPASICSIVASLPDGPVKSVVEDLRPGRHLRLQDVDLVVLEEFVNGVVRVLEIAQLARARRAGLTAGGREALRDPVVAERALVDRLGPRVDEAAAVRAGKDAVPAAEAVGLVDHDNAVRAHERGADRADLDAGRMGAVVAELRDEEVLRALTRLVFFSEAVIAAVRRIDLRPLHLGPLDVVPLNPGPEEGRLDWHVVLGLTGPHAVPAADAPVDVDRHRPPVLGRLVVRGLLGRPRQDVLVSGGSGRGEEQKPPTRGEEVPAVHFRFAHFLASWTAGFSGPFSGWWGAWHSLQGPPSMCVFGSI